MNDRYKILIIIILIFILIWLYIAIITDPNSHFYRGEKDSEKGDSEKEDLEKGDLEKEENKKEENKNEKLHRTILKDSRNGFIRGCLFSAIGGNIFEIIEMGIIWGLITPISNLFIHKLDISDKNNLNKK